LGKRVKREPAGRPYSPAHYANAGKQGNKSEGQEKKLPRKRGDNGATRQQERCNVRYPRYFRQPGNLERLPCL
jgi:hypothetical protein